MLGAAFTLPDLTSNNEVWEDDEMNSGRDHDERRKAQAAAARKPRLKKKHNKATRNNWKKEM